MCYAIYSLKNRQIIRSSKQGRGTVILEFRKNDIERIIAD